MSASARQPQRRELRSGTKKRLKMLLFALFLFLVWTGSKLWDQFGEVNARMEQLEQAERRLAETRERNEAYKLEINRLNDPEYIEQLLRKELHMVKEGETLFIETE
jgi:Septum formation initiator